MYTFACETMYKYVQPPLNFFELPLPMNFDVSRYIKSLKETGGIVNHSILIATAKGILSHKNPGLLKEHSAPITPICLSSTWAESFLHRIRYVKCKATARKLPDDFPEVKQAFLQSQE